MVNFSKPQSMMTMLVTLFALLHVSVALQHGASQQHAARSADAALEARINDITDELQKRQSSGTIAITGPCGADGACGSGRTSYPRLEIRELNKNADQWNLYILGMERFQAMDKNDPLSYYQIAAVHGRPYRTWNNFPTPLVNQAGFCPHSNVLFGSWHRPYLAVFEQAWYKCVLEVVAQFPSGQRQRWQNAASTLRMPFWDWAMDNGDVVPSVMRDDRVRVTKPNGSAVINNPLASYSWGRSVPSEIGGTPWNNFPQTLRRPIANPTRSNNEELVSRFNSIRISLRDRLFALFASKQNWGSASTSAIGVRTDLSGSGVDSFEGVHDVVHNIAGGESGGHMYYLDISSYDPLFWLHHFNVDRILAMYQLIVPDSYVANGNINRGMAQWNRGEPKNAYSPLKPFTKDTSGTYFTSVDVKETRVFGYYYPETSDRSYSQVARAVTSLYGSGGRSITKRTDERTGQYLGRPLKEGDYHHVFSIIADKFALDGSYTVYCFIGKSGGSAAHGNSTGRYDASKDFTLDPNYVGAYGILGGMKAGGGNSSAEPVMTEGSLPLTTCLQGKEHHGELASLKPEHVEPYLAENMYYKVIGVQGELNPEDIPNFHVSVKSTKVKPAASEDELPDLSAPYKVLPDATAHLPAGKPFTYVPSAVDIPLPASPEYERPCKDGAKPTSPVPWEEDGYCAAQQTVHYVDSTGKFLYAEM